MSYNGIGGWEKSDGGSSGGSSSGSGESSDGNAGEGGLLFAKVLCESLAGNKERYGLRLAGNALSDAAAGRIFRGLVPKGVEMSGRIPGAGDADDGGELLSISCLDLSFNGFQPAARDLACVLEANASLVELRLEGNRLREDCGICMRLAIAQNTKLCFLRLEGNLPKPLLLSDRLACEKQLWSNRRRNRSQIYCRLIGSGQFSNFRYGRYIN